MRRHLTRSLLRRAAASATPAAEPAAAAAAAPLLPHVCGVPLLRAGARALHAGAPWAGGGASWGRVAGSVAATAPLRGAALQQRRGMFIQTQPTPNPQRRARMRRALPQTHNNCDADTHAWRHTPLFTPLAVSCFCPAAPCCPPAPWTSPPRAMACARPWRASSSPSTARAHKNTHNTHATKTLIVSALSALTLRCVFLLFSPASPAAQAWRPCSSAPTS
jgi:hypothetical protein